MFLFEQRIFYSKNGKDEYLKYYKYLPEKCSDKIPLIVYVHGAGSRGDDLSLLNSDIGPLGEVKKGRKINAAIVSPQCHYDTWFDLFGVLLEFIEEMINKPKIDKNRIYLCGVSMGAYAAWQVAMSKPNWFAELVAVCGGGMYWNAQRFKELPVWAFHGALDTTVLPEESIRMVKAINNCGGNAKITIFPNDNHDSWTKTFSNDEMWEWMFKQKRG